MKRIDCLTLLSERLGDDDLVVIGIAGVGWEWAQLPASEREANMRIGSMGTAVAVGLGMALSLPHRRVVVLDADGSTLLDLPTLTTIGWYQPQNLSVFIFDNECYSGSRISQPTATSQRTSIEVMAKGAGISSAETVTDIERFEQAVEVMNDGCLHYTVVKVPEEVDSRKLTKPTMDYVEHKYRFMRFIERTEGIDDIFMPHR